MLFNQLATAGYSYNVVYHVRDIIKAALAEAVDQASDTSFEFECIVSTGLNTPRAMSLNSDPNRSRFFQEQAAACWHKE